MHIRAKILFLTIFSCSFLHAQKLATSPFSYQGIGEDGAYADNLYGAYGNAQTSVIDSTTVNTFNPASYSYLSKGQTLFGLGVSSHFSTFTQNGQKYNSKVIGLNSLAFVFPVNNRLGLAGGLQPFSRKGYSIQEKVKVNTDSVTNSYIGSGSLQQIFIGASYKVINGKRNSLAIGANGGILFGNVSNERRAVFDGNGTAGAVDLSSYRTKSFYYSAGLNYIYQLDSLSNKSLTISAVFTPQQNISVSKDYGSYYSVNVENRNSYVPVQEITNDKGTVSYPQKMAFGFGYSFKPNLEKRAGKSVYQLNTYGDIVLTSWSTYKENFVQAGNTISYKDGLQIAFGGQFIPFADATIKAAKYDVLKHIKYRLGVSYALLPYQQNNVQLNQKLVSAGLGIPLAGAKSNSFLNLSFQYGTRGTGNTSDIKENFYSINLGVVIAPQPYDRWFRKYKLD